MILRKVNIAEYRSLAEIHQTAFKNFFLSSLGLPFLRTYYKACLKDPTSIVICAVDDKGNIKGFASGTTIASGYHKRLFLKNWASFFFVMLKYLIANPIAVYRLLMNIEKAPGINIGKNYAELLSIAVIPELKGTGIGKQLLDMFCQEVQLKDIAGITLTTDAKKNDRVVSFYKKCSFVVDHDFITYPNRKMYRMIKVLSL